MKFAYRILVIAFILISSPVLVCCSSTTEKANSLTNDRLLQMLKIIPANCSGIDFYDIETIRNDSNLEGNWKLMQESMCVDNATESFGTTCAIIFEVSDVEEKVAVIDQESSFSYEYDGYTIWASQEFDDPWVHSGDEYYITQIRDFIIIAESEEPILHFIDVANGKEESLESNKDIQEVLYHLPDGYEITAGEWFDIDGYELPFIATGQSITNKDEKAIYTQTVKCVDAEIAQAYIEEMTIDGESVNITRDGAFITETYVDDDITIHTLPGINPPPWWNE